MTSRRSSRPFENAPAPGSKRAAPASMRVPPRSVEEDVWGGRNQVFSSDDARIWMTRMAERGWTAPTWPREYGGGGLGKDEAKILDEELARIGARIALKSLGIWDARAALLQYGSEEQKREHVPRMVRGEIRCQGYSEPAAGSDLASCRTRAVVDGDEVRGDWPKGVDLPRGAGRLDFLSRAHGNPKRAEARGNQLPPHRQCARPA